MSDLAAPVSIREWTCSSAILAIYKMRNGLPLCSMRRLAGRLFTTYRQFFVGTVVGVQVHCLLCICVRGPQYCLRSLFCTKVLTHLGAGSCARLLLIHAGCSCPMWLCTISRINRNPSADFWFVCAAPTSMGSSSITWCSFFRSFSFSRATSVAVLRILACTVLNRWPAKALSVNPFRKLTTLPSSPMLWGRRAWLQNRRIYAMVFSSGLCLIECSFFCKHIFSTADTNETRKRSTTWLMRVSR